MEPHFHLHTLIPGGVLSEQGAWIAASPKFLFPIGALSQVFPEKILDVFRGAHQK